MSPSATSSTGSLPGASSSSEPTSRSFVYLERWRRLGLGWTGRALVRVPMSHQHYAPDTDRRWVCRDDPCLKSYAAAEPGA